MQYPANIRIIRVMCSGSVSPHHVLRAFQQGVDGVFVGG
jgi:F420-non-reducing hydrogenase iron-sulfur subunit